MKRINVKAELDHPKSSKQCSCQVTQCLTMHLACVCHCFPRNFLVLQWDYDNDWTKRAIQWRSSEL